ncbi:MAG: MOSC domain-containing protein [Gammaproteobacteria bacterium]
MHHQTVDQLESGLDKVRQSPKDHGALEMIVSRPETGHREFMEQAELCLQAGLVGDNWSLRNTGPAPAHPDRQLAIMNARAATLIAASRDRWSLAGDQLYLDLDLSHRNLPAGTRLSIGSAVIEITAEPHTGCQKFVERFGADAMRFVNSPVGRSLNLRGTFARIFQPGVIHVGDVVSRV